MKRKPIYSLTENHGPQFIEESYPDEPVPQGMIYIEKRTLAIIRPKRISEIPADAIELPETTWFYSPKTPARVVGRFISRLHHKYGELS